MYNINVKYLKVWYLIGGIFLIVGIAFLCVSFIFSSNNKRKLKEYKGIAEAYEIDKNCSESLDKDKTISCSPVYKFRVDDKEYMCATNGSSSLKNFDKKKKVYYNLSNPNECLNEYEISIEKTFSFMNILYIFFIILGLSFIAYNMKKSIKIKSLNKKGTLFKNLPYEIVPSNYFENGVRLNCIKVNFTLPNGETKVLKSFPIRDGKIADSDGYVDLLINLDDTTNYYLDFNIDTKV